MLLAATAVVSVMLFSTLLNYDRNTHPKGELYPIAITGEYSEEGGPWTPFTPQTNFNNLYLRNITLRGNFTADLPRGHKLFMKIDHVWVALSVNGSEIFRLEPTQGDGNPTRAMGKQWAAVISPGITTTDRVELGFGNLYRNAYMIQFDELLRHMYTGEERMMLFQAAREDGWTLAVGTVFLFLTLFLTVTAICCSVLRIRGAWRFLCLGMTALFSALWFYTLSPAPTLVLPWPIFLNVLYAFSMQCMAMFVTLFVISHLSGWRRRLLLIWEGVLLLLLLVGVINQIFGIQDLYSAINYYSVLDVAVALCIVFCLGYEAFYMKNEECAELQKALFLLVLCAIIELINGYVQFLEAAILLGIGFIVFTVSEGLFTLRRIQRSMENEKRAFILENELNENRIAIMLSQVQPHFLYNALNSISVLCRKDPQLAEETVNRFSDFLRGNLDSLTTRELIPFSQEKTHVESYLEIEKTRFGTRLNIEYDFAVTDFLLPCLTIQPVVENAVRYGVTKKKGGGTVKVSTRETDQAYLVEVEDDGIGFQSDLPSAGSRSHVGLENVKKRLSAQCGGSLEISSIPGQGTVVTITMPKRGG